MISNCKPPSLKSCTFWCMETLWINICWKIRAMLGVDGMNASFRWIVRTAPIFTYVKFLFNVVQAFLYSTRCDSMECGTDTADTRPCMHICKLPALIIATQHLPGVAPHGPYHTAHGTMKNIGNPQDRIASVRKFHLKWHFIKGTVAMLQLCISAFPCYIVEC